MTVKPSPLSNRSVRRTCGQGVVMRIDAESVAELADGARLPQILRHLSAPVCEGGGWDEPVIGEAEGDVCLGGGEDGVAEAEELAADVVFLRGAGWLQRMGEEMGDSDGMGLDGSESEAETRGTLLGGGGRIRLEIRGTLLDGSVAVVSWRGLSIR